MVFFTHFELNYTHEDSRFLYCTCLTQANQEKKVPTLASAYLSMFTKKQMESPNGEGGS